MKKYLILFFILGFLHNAFSKNIVVTQKVSEPYIGNISRDCVRKMSHKAIEVINHLKYFEVKKKNNVVVNFDPVGIDQNSLYIWAELSPNGKMLLFNSSDKGVFVCNLKGEILYKFGRDVHAVSWWDNKYIVGMIDEDDGMNFTKSELVMIKINTGERIPIITEEAIAVYPCANKPYVEYFTQDNIKYTIKLKIKN